MKKISSKNIKDMYLISSYKNTNVFFLTVFFFFLHKVSTI